MSAAHILVVDDEADIRGLLKEILSEEGYDVDVAGDAGQARASRARQLPDLVHGPDHALAGRSGAPHPGAHARAVVHRRLRRSAARPRRRLRRAAVPGHGLVRGVR